MSKRILVLDIARGAAILGTLGTNIWIFSNLGNYEVLLGTETTSVFTLDLILEAIVLFFTNGKFLGLLTILFGIGLELKRQSYIRNNKEKLWIWVYIWGMLLLLADGFLHYLFVFEYDVLMGYAITGIIVALLIKCKTSVIKTVTITLGVIHIVGILLFSILIEIIMRVDEFREEFLMMMNEISYVYLTGSYFDQVLLRLNDFWGMRGEAIAIIPMNILLFLFGVYLVRKGIFRQSPESIQARKKYLFWGLAIGIPLNALMFIPLFSLGVIVRYLFAPLMALGYLMAFHWLVEKRPDRFILRRLSEVGRTALSCYMLQNIMASIIFYGWGFGLGGRVNALQTIAILAFICLSMMVFAHLWLKKFNHGPFEIIWRWLTALPFNQLKNKKVG
ncbi:DUF418 domain-containing protein [Evansella cellulosilytica]|uniref:DUF418 domain-containing protein n=1 Tax=Evansella cellulosilytica (strain ATCC 21833 / DSM 2522 / FERM P-1141 / JCM 9156 / N-4) TaxID=649639 RepID=E6TRR5_EVAC2|nr:DUF418 domain-containing protein [Evansella cellulosilytica]ADU29438.1 protein of unknown function DUF418 [Evansella cellulosilytica DSM 2522]